MAKTATANGRVNNPEIGARARARREELGILMREMAHTLNVGSTRMSAMELEGVEGITTILRWARALDMSPIYLAFGTKMFAPKKGAK